MADWTYSARHGAWYLGAPGFTAKAFDSGEWNVRDANDAVVASGQEPSVDAAKVSAALELANAQE